MKAVRIHARGGAEGLVLEDAPVPQLGVGDVLVGVHAASFTPDELTWPTTWTDRAGRDRTPSVPAHEVSGVVAARGDGTTGPPVGTRVFGLTDLHRDGAAAEYVAAEARDLAVLPDGIDHIVGAAMPMAGLTAWQALFRHGELRAGQSVLVHGAGGGVGSLAVELARDTGARVVASGRATARELALSLGAEAFVALDEQPFEDVVGQVDLVFDTIGGDVLARSAAVVAPGGALVSIAAPPPVKSVDGRAVYFIVESDRAQLAEIAARVASGRLRPHVGAVYPLDETRAAFEAKQRGLPGKVVLRVRSDDE